MSRIIKFRVWDKKTEWMDIGPLWLDDYGKLWEEPKKTYNTPHVEIVTTDENRHVVMQFTGLLDKNGKEIYEGDRIRYFSAIEGDIDGVVEWNSEDAAFIVNDKEQSMFLMDWHPQTCEVIGNIYANPRNP